MLLAVGAYSVHEHTKLSAQFSGWWQRSRGAIPEN